MVSDDLSELTNFGDISRKLNLNSNLTNCGLPIFPMKTIAETITQILREIFTTFTTEK